MLNKNQWQDCALNKMYSKNDVDDMSVHVHNQLSTCHHCDCVVNQAWVCSNV